jgi:SagB-type dehydrogenase family enzyme
MKRIYLFTAICFLSATLIAPAAGVAEEAKRIDLPRPQTEGGKRLMEALKNRKSSRDFRPDELPPQVLSNLLWAAFGVNRPESGGRTAPSAHGWNEIDIYVATANGLYAFDAKSHSLKTVHSDDVRAKTGLQSFVVQAPINLIYVANLSRMSGASEEDKNFYSAADTGFVSQNVYLFAASEGLATVVRGSIDRRTLAQAMHLRPEQKIVLAQTVGYPK